MEHQGRKTDSRARHQSITGFRTSSKSAGRAGETSVDECRSGTDRVGQNGRGKIRSRKIERQNRLGFCASLIEALAANLDLSASQPLIEQRTVASINGINFGFRDALYVFISLWPLFRPAIAHIGFLTFGIRTHDCEVVAGTKVFM